MGFLLRREPIFFQKDLHILQIFTTFVGDFMNEGHI